MACNRLAFFFAISGIALSICVRQQLEAPPHAREVVVQAGQLRLKEDSNIIIENGSPFQVNILLKDYFSGALVEKRNGLLPLQSFESKRSYWQTITLSGCLSFDEIDEVTFAVAQLGSSTAVAKVALGGVLKTVGAKMAVTGGVGFALHAGAHGLAGLAAVCPPCALVLGLMVAGGAFHAMNLGWTATNLAASSLMYMASMWVRQWLQRVSLDYNQDLLLHFEGQRFRLRKLPVNRVRTVYWSDLATNKKHLRVMSLRSLSAAMKNNDVFEKTESPSSFFLRQSFQKQTKASSSSSEANASDPSSMTFGAPWKKTLEIKRLQNAFEFGVAQYRGTDHAYSLVGEENIYISRKAFASFVQDQTTYSAMDASLSKGKTTICGGFGDPEPYVVYTGKLPDAEPGVTKESYSVIYVVNTYNNLALRSKCPKQTYNKLQIDPI
eukprot:TRINITY_DN37732_c0_g1_i1.p1 TRINITY_DN37732_c0_g1~~TRINITY_DN37732_c0_g1_i1.p1  ORF type:complete len:438 (-),score=67.79 TRINITY_DN37732_c0_g1_i1:116-1429(-)